MPRFQLPPSIPDDDLFAKCSPRGAGNGGDVVWVSCFASYLDPAAGIRWEQKKAKDPAMAYRMEHWTSTKRYHRTIDEITVTNLYCGVGEGWDIVVCGTIMQHEKYKSHAQAIAEKLLDGQL